MLAGSEKGNNTLEWPNSS